MRKNHGVSFLLFTFGILLLSGAVLSGAGRAMIFYKQSASQKSILRGVESIQNASIGVSENMSDLVAEIASDKYEFFKKIVDDGNNAIIKENTLENYYRNAIVNDFKLRTGGRSGLYEYIRSTMPEPKSGKLYLRDDVGPELVIEKSEDGGIDSAYIKNVTFVYDGIPGIQRSETYRYNIIFPKAVFYAGNEELFDYALLSGKGIYVTGATSSIVGNIYAGEHLAQESRDMEISYGEIGSYGGVNFESTQVGIQADKVISEGDINLNGSFVIFSPEKEALAECFADRIRKMRGYNSDSMYSIEGDFYESNALSEEKMTEYLAHRDMARLSLSKLEDIPFYYDSDNDPYYEGTYQKIISSGDLQLSKDITGLVVIAGNLIVDPGVNIEGLVLVGDRIYMQGNNSIVANSQIVKKIISEEAYTKNSISNVTITVEGREEEIEPQSDVLYLALDYIGGLKSPGLKKENYYVAPYQE